MDQWRPFDIRSFLKESKKWDGQIKKLEEELENISELPSTGNNPVVGNGNISDLTAKTAVRRFEISAEIEEIKLNKEMLAFAMKRLSDDEKQLIQGFYYPKKRIDRFISDYGSEHGLCRSYVYEKLNRTLDKMGRMILKMYYE